MCQRQVRQHSTEGTYWLKMTDSETMKLKTVKPFARIENGKISTEYLFHFVKRAS